MVLGGGVQGERDARVLEWCADVDYEARGCAVLGRVCVKACYVDPLAPRDARACLFWVLVRMNDRGSRSRGASAVEQALKSALSRKAACSSAGVGTTTVRWATAPAAPIASRR